MSLEASPFKWEEWVKRKKLPKRHKGHSLSVVDAFSGCGGMSLGVAEGASWIGRSLDVKLAVDFDEDAIDVYRKNFLLDDSVARLADVGAIFDGGLGCSLSEKEYAAVRQVGDLDLLVAGPPCQGHSNLNNRSRRDDPRNQLYRRAVRMVEVLAPKVAIIENVPGVVHDAGRNVHDSAGFLVSLGYSVVQAVYSLEKIGLAQSRRRHVTIASRVHGIEELERCVTLPARTSGTLSSFIGDIVDECIESTSPFNAAPKLSLDNASRVDWLFRNDEFDLPDHLRPACHRDKAHSYRSMYGRLRWDGPSQTITSGFGSMGQGRFVHPIRPRTLTCHEAARIQGFPDFFDFGSCGRVTSLRKMIGNAVPPALCAELVHRLFSEH